MMDPSSRPARKIQVADHIWQAFEEMASQMGSERDALINQAMFMFARLNGFLDGGGRAYASSATPQPRPQPAPAPRQNGAPPMLKPVQPASSPQGSLEDDPARREVQERVLETAAELERLIKSKNQGAGEPPGSEGEGGEGRA